MDQKKETNKWLEGRRYHVVRIALFAFACIFAAAGMLMLTFSTGQLTRTQQVASEMVQMETKADVLLLMSYDDSDIPTTMQRDGVLDVLRRSSVQVDVEYLDVRSWRSGSAALWEQVVAEKVASHGKYSLVIACDDEALGFVEQKHDTLFTNMPVVFLGINDLEHAQAVVAKGYATGLVEEYDVATMMQIAKNMRPEANSFTVIYDNTASGLGDIAQFKAAQIMFPTLSANYLNASKLTREELGNRISKLNESTIVLMLDAQNDIDGNSYTLDESCYFISKMASQPVFRAGFGGVGEGIIGSGFTDYEADGSRAADIAVMVLNGKRPADIPLEGDLAKGSVFDAKVMDEYHIPQSLLPSDAALINQSGISLDSLRPILAPIALILVGVLFVVIFALMGYRRNVANMREIISQRNQLERRFYTDHLTDIPNMQWLTAYATKEASDKVRSIAEVAIVGISEMQDSYGREFTDEVIKVVAERLSGLEKVFLVRPGQGAFIIGFDRTLKRGGEVLDAIEFVLNQPVEVEGDSIKLDTRIGIYNRERGMSIEEMVAGVDIAIRQAEQIGAGRGEIIFYDAAMRRAIEDKLEITSRLKKSIAAEDFVVVYQPQVALETNDVAGYEALVRFKDSTYTPAQFIPVAEMNGLVVDVGRIVTKKAIQQLSTWRKRNKRMRPISINYSFVQLKDEGYVQYLLDLLEKYEIASSFITIEISENLFISNMAKAHELIARLQSEGIRVAIDDFGAGYTSISRVMDIPADIVKIDKSLTDEYLAGGEEGVIGNLVRLVHGVNKAIVIEGIETREQLEICRRIECDVVQGFYYSQPLLPERAVQYKPPVE